MAGTTARGAFPFPDGGDPPDTDGAIRTLAQAVDAKVALDFQGLLVDRPVAGVRGRFYFATDNGLLYRDTGTAWVNLRNADTLDGLDSSAFLLAGAKAADADTLDGIDSTGFVRRTAGDGANQQIEGFTDHTRTATLADAVNSTLDTQNVANSNVGGGNRVRLLARLLRTIAGAGASNAAVELVRVTDVSTQTGLQFHGDRIEAFGGRLIADSGVASSRMRTQELFVGVVESTTATTYAALATAQEVEFVVPPSERFTVHLRAEVAHGSSTEFAHMSFDLFDLNANGVNLGPNDDRAIYSYGLGRDVVGAAIPIVLAAGHAGRTFRARARFRVNAGTGTFLRRQITVVPSL
jgi:hypothetical protein